MRANMFRQLLEDLNRSTADIEAAALISTVGLMIASTLPQGMHEDRSGAVSAAWLSLGERTAGELVRVPIQGERGYIIMSAACPEAGLSVLAKFNAKLCLIFLDIKRVAETFFKLI